MSILNARVSPEPPSTHTALGTELSDSLGQEKEKDNFTNNEGKETSTIDDQGTTTECQEGLDGIGATAEEQLYNASGMIQNGKTSRAGSQIPKRLSLDVEEASSPVPRPRYQTCDRVILLALCLLSAASVALTLLMLFGVVGPLNCACTKKTESDTTTSTASKDFAKLSKNIEDLKENVSFLNKETAVVTDIAEMKKKYELLQAEMNAIKRQSISHSTNKSESHENQDNSTVLLQSLMQRVMQIDQKINNSKTPGPRGPPGISGPPGPRGYNGTQGNPGLPGYNGTQGPPGVSGSTGPRGYNGTQGNPGLSGYNGTQGPRGVSGSPGPRGYNGSQGAPGNSASGGLSLCSYKEKKATDSPGPYASADVEEGEPNGKMFIGVSCGTNDAKTVEMTSTESGGKRTYKCSCEGTINSGVATMYCAIYYWECST